MATQMQYFVKSSHILQYNSKTIQSIFMKFSGKIDIVLSFTYSYIINMGINQHGFHSIGGSRGGREGRTPPPGRPNSFDFMQFSGKFGVFTPPLEGSRPPLGKILDPPLHSHVYLQYSVKFLIYFNVTKRLFNESS